MQMILTPYFEASFPSLDVPTSMDENSTKKYRLTLVFDKDVDLTAIETAINDAIKAKWGDKVPKSLKLPIKDGDDTESDWLVGKKFIRATTKNKVKVVGPDGSPIDPDEIASGTICRAFVSASAFDLQTSKGVNIWLAGVQKVREGAGYSSVSFDAVPDSDVVSSGSDW